jgi:hypothetical protein
VTATILGVVLVVTMASSVARALVIPRPVRSVLGTRLSRAGLGVFQLVAELAAALRRSGKYEVKDHVLVFAAPVNLLGKLVGWLLGFLLGYGLLLYGVSTLGFAQAVREAGSSLFTLGFAGPDRDRLTYLDYAAAATGPITIGIMVGYLPTFYGAYARRETEVTLLRARAGVPAWGPEILARYAQVGMEDALVPLFAGWERWAADITESHTSYPLLVYFRSTRPQLNWLVSLIAVMDAAALHLALNPAQPQSQVRMALRAGFSCLRAIADVEGIGYDPDPDPDDPIQLGYADFLDGIDRLRAEGYPMQRPPTEAWPHFRGWRVNYEAIAYTLAYRIDAVPARWSGVRRQPTATIDVVTPIDRKPAGTGGP